VVLCMHRFFVTVTNYNTSMTFLLLEALQLPRTFGLLNQFFPFRSIPDAVLPAVYSRFYHTIFTSSSHLFLGLPSGLVDRGVQSYTFLTILSSGTRCTCPNQANLCALMCDL
jgi:hypothetical protein